MKKLERALVVISVSCLLVALATISFLMFKMGALEARVSLLEDSQREVLDRIDMSSTKLIDVIRRWERIGKEQPIVVKLRDTDPSPEGVSTPD